MCRYLRYSLFLFTLQYKTERDGKFETRVEKKVVISEDGDDIDHDEVRIHRLP